MVWRGKQKSCNESLMDLVYSEDENGETRQDHEKATRQVSILQRKSGIRKMRPSLAEVPRLLVCLEAAEEGTRHSGRCLRGRNTQTAHLMAQKWSCGMSWMDCYLSGEMLCLRKLESKISSRGLQALRWSCEDVVSLFPQAEAKDTADLWGLVFEA